MSGVGVAMGQENTAPRKIDGVEGAAGQLTVSGGPGQIESWAESAITPIGGICIRLLNKTGAASVLGTIVQADTVIDNAFKVCGVDGVMPIAVVYQAGVADGSLCWIVIYGIAQVLLKDATASTKGYWVYVSDAAGRADATLAAPPGGGIPELDVHMGEIGHCIESKGADTDVLAKVILHFN